MGGDFFFGNGSYPARIAFTDDMENPVRQVLIRHLAVSAVALSEGARACNCLMHISARQKDHERTVTEVNKWLDHWSAHKDELVSEIGRACEDAGLSEHDPDGSSPALRAHAMILENRIGVMMVNARGNAGQAAGRLAEACTSGCNIIVGGNVLGRGLTIPCLQTTYYARHSKYPQADTVWQHSRMFGYDRDPRLVKVFIPKKLYKIFADLNNTNNSMVAQAQAGAGKIKFFYAGPIRPTRSNVLDSGAQAAVAGGTNYFASMPGNRTYEDLCRLLEPFGEDVPVHQVALSFISRLLSHIVASEDFRLSSYTAFLEAITADRPAAQGRLIVRRGRDITQGTGALLSESDWKLGAGIKNEVVLTMYQVRGDKGWGGSPLWVPNIKFPDDMTFFDVIEPGQPQDAEGKG